MAKNNRVAIQHYHTLTSTTIPSSDAISHGEIAVMATKENEKLIIKNSADSIETISSDKFNKETYVPKVGDTTIEGDLVIKGSIISTKGFYEDPNGGESDIEMMEYATTDYVNNQIESLDSVVTAQNGYYISGITQNNGKITSVGTAKLPSAGEMGTLTAVTVTAGNGLTNGGTISGTNGAVTLNVGAGTGIAVAADSVSINSDYQNKINQGVSALTKINAFLQNAEMTGEAVDTLVEIQRYIDADSGATSQLLTRVEDAYIMAETAQDTADKAQNWAAYAQDIAHLAQTDATSALQTANSKQDKLTSGTNIKTINNTSILGSGNISVGTYSKPSGGIPKTDLASDVQTSLGKADNALPKDGKAASATIADSFSQHKVTNLNNIVKGKFFQSSPGADNLPEDTTSEYLTGFSLATNNDDNYQVAFGLDYSGNAYTRSEQAGKWNPWKRLAYTDSKVASATSADTATKATQDGSGNVITSTYATKTELNGKQPTISDLATIRNNAQSGASAYTKINAFLNNAEMTGEAVDTLVEIQRYIDADSGATSQLLTRVEDAYIMAETAQDWAASAQDTAHLAQTDATSALQTANSKQDKLTSGTNIKTINNTSILGSGNISVGTYSKPSGGIPKSDLASDAIEKWYSITPYEYTNSIIYHYYTKIATFKNVDPRYLNTVLRFRLFEDVNHPSYGEYVLRLNYLPSYARCVTLSQTAVSTRNLEVYVTSKSNTSILNDEYSVWVRSDIEWTSSLEFKIEKDTYSATTTDAIYTSNFEQLIEEPANVVWSCTNNGLVRIYDDTTHSAVGMNTNETWDSLTNKFTADLLCGNIKLKTPRSLWGQSFDGTGDVKGAITIEASGSDAMVKTKSASYELGFGVGSGGINRGIFDATNKEWMIYRDKTTNVIIPQGNIGIGISSPIEKLHVNGNVKADSFVGNLNWSYLQSKPTTLAGYGITDAYTTTQVDNKFLKLSGGRLTSSSTTLLSLNSTQENEVDVGLRFEMNSVSKGWVGYDPTFGTYLYTYSNPHRIGIKDNGTGHIDNQPILHSGNYTDYTYSKTQVDNKLTGYSTTAHMHKVKINGNEKTISGTTAVDLGTYLTAHQTLPTGSTSTLGMVKAGSFLSATNGTISVSTGTTSATVARGDHNHDTVYWKRTEKVASATTADNATRATYANCDGEGLGIKDTYLKIANYTDQKVKADATSSKIFLLGHTSSATSTSEAYKNANVYTQNGNVYATAFYQTSDERMKTFGDEIEVDFEKLSKLRKSKFVFNNDDDKTHIGVSAQEVKEIYPEMVDEDENGYLKVDYSKLSVVALKAVDKLYEEMTEIKALIKELLNK